MKKKIYVTPTVITRVICPSKLFAGSFSYHDEDANEDVGAGSKSSMWDSMDYK